MAASAATSTHGGAAAASTTSHAGAYPRPASSTAGAATAACVPSLPTPAPATASHFTWAALSFGGRHGAGITTSGRLLTWGLNDRGQAGWGADRAYSGHGPGGGASAGAGTAAAATAAVSAAGTGAGAGAGAGAAARHGPGGQQGAGELGLPRPVALAPSVTVVAVACGGEHTLALTGVGVMAWGCNRLNQCGLGQGAPATAWRPEPVPALLGLPVCQLAAGREHSLALTQQSQVFSWGGNASGQLGLGDRHSRASPTRLEGLWALPVVAIAAGAVHSAAVTASGHAFVWGSNHYGQLGLLPEPWLEPAAAAGGRAGGSSGPGRGVAVSSDVGGGGGPSKGGGMRAEAGSPPSTPPRAGGRPLALGLQFSPGSPRSPGARRAAMRRNNGSLGRRGCDSAGLLAMVEMGIPRRHARIALEETGNAGVEVATEWLFSADRSAVLNAPSDDEGDGSLHDARSTARRPSAAAAAPAALASAAAARAALSRHAARPAAEGGKAAQSLGLGARAREEAAEEGREGAWCEDELVVLEPRRVPLKGVRALAAGARHTVALTDDGVYAWGEGGAGALGLGDDEDRDMPCRLPMFASAAHAGPAFIAAAATAAAAAAAAVAAGGSGGWAAGGEATRTGMGLGAAVQQAEIAAGGVRSRLARTAHSLAAAAAAPAILRVAAGARHTLFLATDGAVYWCGTMPPVAAAAAPAAATAVAGRGAAAAAAAAGPRALAAPAAGTVPLPGLASPGPAPRPEALHAEAPAGGGDRRATLSVSWVPRQLDLPRPRTASLGAASAGGAGGGGGGGGRESGAGRARTAPAAPVVFDVVAGGGTSGLLYCSPQEVAQQMATAAALPGPALLNRLRTSIECAAQARAAGVDLATLSACLKAVTAGVQMVLSSPAAITAAFSRCCRTPGGAAAAAALHPSAAASSNSPVGSGGSGGGGSSTSGSSSWSATSSSGSAMGLDAQLLDDVLTSVRQLFAARPGDDANVASTVAELHRFSVVTALQRAATELVDDLAAHARQLGTPERAQVLLAALQHPMLAEPSYARQLMPKLVSTVMAAPAVTRTWLRRGAAGPGGGWTSAGRAGQGLGKPR
ncbi:hypothetical protein HXX76_006817 [Chlamydomonas incerta]|uniref:UBA domain-containing protein n=1 Tax=Chlamydomonas incerta TaxID=51695 RepID=A0A835TA05_CHLIN|nr:hypothetical protein HXX76_006817 [Chlamydomonas incerta]|eukprot:KAG2436519.1 hypothetical protein HXX76_006817 [Chlamydomonas incerta]